MVVCNFQVRNTIWSEILQNTCPEDVKTILSWSTKSKTNPTVPKQEIHNSQLKHQIAAIPPRETMADTYPKRT